MEVATRHNQPTSSASRLSLACSCTDWIPLFFISELYVYRWLYAVFGLLATGVFLAQGIQPASRSSNPTSSSFASASAYTDSPDSQRNNKSRLAALFGAKRASGTSAPPPAFEIALGHKVGVKNFYVPELTKEDLDREEERVWREEREKREGGGTACLSPGVWP